jgi:hypothetical protein
VGRPIAVRARPFLVGVLAVPAVVVATAGADAAASPTVSLTLGVRGATAGQVTRAPDQAVTLFAKAATLPAGGQIAIEGWQSTDLKPFLIKQCGSATCSVRWAEHNIGRVNFQALVVRRATGRPTVLGRSKTLTVLWQGALSPPPSPVTSPLSADPPKLNFGAVPEGMQPVNEIAITNVGNSDLHLVSSTQPSRPFVEIGVSVGCNSLSTLAPGSAC